MGPPDSMPQVEKLIVSRVEAMTPEVLRIEFTHPSGGRLPAWTPGAHVELYLPSGLIRQYSLCGDPQDRTRYCIAVLREETGRGGSLELCGLVADGVTVSLGHPRNHFPLVSAPEYLFLAGGIGVTPILAMAREAARGGSEWTLVYCGRSRATMGFADELKQIPGGTLVLMPEDELGRPDLDSLIGNVKRGTQIYCCGPAGMIDAAVQVAERTGRAAMLHIERFSSPVGRQTDEACNTAFEVELARSGQVLTVPPYRRLGDVLVEAGVPVKFSCAEGYCGTCETRVLAGICDHRDTVLSDEDRASGQYMMVCVSRAKSPRLVLDV